MSQPPEHHADGLDPAKRRTVDDLPEEWRERYLERAAIMEVDGELPRFWAEAMALLDTLKCMRREGAGDGAPLHAESSASPLALPPHGASRLVVNDATAERKWGGC